MNLWTVGCADPHKLHSTPQQDRMYLISGKGETSSGYRPLAYSSPEPVQTPGTVAVSAGVASTPGVMIAGSWSGASWRLPYHRFHP
jgi:hypothetical protein